MADDYTVTGSGMQLVYGLLENEYAEDLSLEEAGTVAARAIKSAVERDTGPATASSSPRSRTRASTSRATNDFDAVI